MSNKIHIEKDSVEETLIIPLYARIQCSKLYPELYSDSLSEEALNRIDYSFSKNTNDNSLARSNFLCMWTVLLF